MMWNSLPVFLMDDWFYEKVVDFEKDTNTKEREKADRAVVKQVMAVEIV